MKTTFNTVNTDDGSGVNGKCPCNSPVVNGHSEKVGTKQPVTGSLDHQLFLLMISAKNLSKLLLIIHTMV